MDLRSATIYAEIYSTGEGLTLIIDKNDGTVVMTVLHALTSDKQISTVVTRASEKK